ncbi:MAG: Small acid-soluble spore protein alpha/beta type [Clostridia bacterium 62_21]|nr:MAG: Small acid-soluble spore protein alpha/beta type [Clostridia bacterium 62_21]HAG07841.1 spore protein [Peptococcaceae bacterium]
MAQGQRTNRVLVPEARAALDQLKWEIAREVGINLPPGSYLGDVPSRQNGAIGGHMVRRMIQAYEQNLAGNFAGTTNLR